MIKKFKFVIFVLLFLGAGAYALLFLLNTDIAVLNPKGMIAAKERTLIIVATLLMLVVVIPVFILTFFFAWKYRASNPKAKYAPDWDHNRVAESIWWAIPCVIVLVLAIITWKGTHELDPFKPIDTGAKPIKIQVVALDWKWLFIYPEQKVASVNFVPFPEKIPIVFEITSDAPMNSFWIPQLGGQVYAMPGMRSKLHLIASEEGSFRGSSANLSGRGFARMTFVAKSTSEADFAKWVQSIHESQQGLNLEEYHRLVEPSIDHQAVSYALKEEDLFDQIVMKYMMPMQQR
jgi:cytochrome o ubiquinol oxidase subunit II